MNTYTVQPGETLEMIAEKLFGDKSMVQYLASINSLPAVPGVTGGWVYLISPGQTLNVDVVEVEGKRWPVGWTIAGLIAASAGIYYRKQIMSFIKSLI